MTAAVAEYDTQSPFFTVSQIPRSTIARLMRIARRVMETSDHNFIANRKLNLSRFPLPTLDNLMVVSQCMREIDEVATAYEKNSLATDLKLYLQITVDFVQRKVVFKNKGYILF